MPDSKIVSGRGATHAARHVFGLLFLAAISGGVHAQDRPSDAEIFGGSSAPETQTAPAQGAPPTTTAPSASAPANPPAPNNALTPSARDEAILGDNEKPMFTEPAAPADPLTIGGQLYFRAQATALEHKSPGDYTLTMPTLLDVFFDVRPNDRVRGFVLGRMYYDPVQPPSSLTSLAPVMTNGGTAGTPSLFPGLGGGTNDPRVLLDQMWIRFDIVHELYVTVGRQHVRWGTGRFWQPADFLHMLHRNPLDVFDARTGTTMLKLHLPIESKSWNFYTYAITEGQNGAPTLSTPAGAARAEFVLDETELGLGVFGRPHTHAKFAADLSTGLGDVDFYGELAVVDASEIDRVRFVPSTELPNPASAEMSTDPSQIDAVYQLYRDQGYRPQLVTGFTYTGKYNDNDTFTLGGEYFYNGLGYDNPDAYYGLFVRGAQASLNNHPLQNPASFFYLGRHYAALFITFPAPFSLDLHTFTLSTLGNLSDLSFITRLDYSLILLTHLRFEAYAAVHYGRLGGEFRYQVPIANQTAPACDLGLGLRIAI